MHDRRRLHNAGALATMTVALGACSGNSGGAPAPVPTTTAIAGCPAYIVAPPSLVSPVSGATGVPASIGHVVVAGVSDGTFQLQALGESPFTVGPVVVVLPAPSATPGEEMSDVAVPLLEPKTTYFVAYVANNPDANCPHEEGGTLGTFATQ